MAMYNVFKFLIIFMLYANIHIIICHATKYNISEYNLFESCTKYNASGKLQFSDIFPVNKDNHYTAKNENFHLKFYVITSSSANILLSPILQPSTSDRVYRVGVGLHKNRYSEIRRFDYWDEHKNNTANSYTTNMTRNILSQFEPTLIEVVQKKDGTLLVYVPSFSIEPLMKFTDPSPLEINYISFSSWYNVSSMWFYSCHFNDSVPEESTIVKKNSTYSKLFYPWTLFMSQYDPLCIDGCPNGLCYISGKCACNTGYYMTNTNICKPVCEGGCLNGYCYAPGKCACNTEYYMTKTNICKPVCEGGCLNGNCVAAGVCACNKGYYMTDTNICKPVCEGGCLNGNCVAPGKCACNTEYYMTKTNICEPVCEGGCLYGNCVAAGVCACNKGYYMTDTNICKPICEGCLNFNCSDSIYE